MRYLTAGNGRSYGYEYGQAIAWEFQQHTFNKSPISIWIEWEHRFCSFTGAEDDSIPAFLSDEVFVGIRRLGKPVKENARAPIDWSYANQVDLANRVINWFNKYLKGEPALNRTSRGGSSSDTPQSSPCSANRG